ncbi:tmk [Wigglesworthia glossinidia endosymbiont of Glossina brevipalpis]|uniref:Thymidylate kinase n=1 Tax=Wigglesworthia glossinidia brevipalpis TaxID=36870 RepID=KTHY_WIGBR|nr:RecName: Full=Thymidylate kinase; AltName: Full=dTMP kinase [Wigglesworthia glossinidia endosymbiont of Glossina brevipalpis]BAC24240.1 tmk [Wigglesworthia glossinidia endosymbiont of Glossina brevipalpis]
MIKSKFIVIEGLEGSGKTNAISKIVNLLNKQGIKNVIFTREPGGTPLAESLRTLIKEGVGYEKITDNAELLMIYAARIQLVESVIKPALENGSWVVGDRHDLSSLAYQGGGRKIDTKILKMLREVFLRDFYPDLTFYLDIPPIMGLARIRARATVRAQIRDKVNKIKRNHSHDIKNALDRIEVEPISFFDRTRKKYKELASKNEKIITIDASKSLELVNKEIKHQLLKWLKKQI